MINRSRLKDPINFDFLRSMGAGDQLFTDLTKSVDTTSRDNNTPLYGPNCAINQDLDVTIKNQDLFQEPHDKGNGQTSGEIAVNNPLHSKSQNKFYPKLLD